MNNIYINQCKIIGYKKQKTSIKLIERKFKYFQTTNNIKTNTYFVVGYI